MENTQTLPKIFSWNFIKILMRGTGQVMFQGNAWTGVFILAGIFYGSYTTGFGAVAWGAVVGLIVSTITGYILHYNINDGNTGLWGFNGILVGCALPTFLGNHILMWITLIFFSAASTWVMAGLNGLLSNHKISAFTFPFVLLTWLVLMATRIMHGIPAPYLSVPELPGHFSSALDTHFISLIIYWLKGISQVFLINSAISGILFLIGLWLCNKWAAIWAAFASAIALGTAILLECNGNDIANGLFGFSPVLTGIALGCTFYKVSWRSMIWGVLGVIATVYFQAAMDTWFVPYGLPTLTGPFCVTTWLFLLPHLELDKKE